MWSTCLDSHQLHTCPPITCKETRIREYVSTVVFPQPAKISSYVSLSQSSMSMSLLKTLTPILENLTFQSCIQKVQSSPPPQYRPSVDRLPPNTAADFQVPNIFFVGYVYIIITTPFTTVVRTNSYFASPGTYFLSSAMCFCLFSRSICSLDMS